MVIPIKKLYLINYILILKSILFVLFVFRKLESAKFEKLCTSSLL